MKVSYIWKDCWYFSVIPRDAFWVEAGIEEVRDKIIPFLVGEKRGKVLEVIDQIQCLNDEIIKRYLNRESKLCFLLSRDLNYFELMHWYYPISQHWGGYCPFERVHFEIYELVELELVNEKGETMARKYPEPVSAIMLRIKDQDEIIFIRQKTEVQFGSSDEIIGAAFLTNPGSFEFKHSPGWNDFKEGKNGNWEDDRFHAVDFADLTMQNLIEVIRQGYKRAGLGSPNGKLKIYNLSNVVQPKGKKAEEYHKKAYRLLESHTERNLSELIDPVITKKELFLEECQLQNFIIMGFVDGVFKKAYNQLIEWSKSLPNVVASLDGKGRNSHPRRWRTDPSLKEAAIQKMEQVLNS